MKILMMRPVANLPSLPAIRPNCTRSMAPDFHITKEIASNLRNFCSADDLSTVP